MESRSYDRAGRLGAISNENAAGNLSFATYGRDPIGNPETITTEDGTQRYAYDDLDRLTRMCLPPACADVSSTDATVYTYDNVGNRDTETSPTHAIDHTYDVDDRLETSTDGSTTTTYGHDANGNVTSDGSRTMTYDHANRTASVTHGGATTTYGYDGLGKRLEASTGSQTIDFQWDVNNALPMLVKETERGVGMLRRYVYGHDLLSMTSGGNDYFFHRDGLGSITNLTDVSGAEQWDYGYDAWGKLTEDESDVDAPANPMTYTGQYLDATGLYHLRARQYEPELGRFTASDPWPTSLADPYVASYAYVNNRPTSFVDPLGLFGWSDAFNVISIGASMVGVAATAVAIVAAAPAIAVTTIAVAGYVSMSSSFLGTMTQCFGGGGLDAACGQSVAGTVVSGLSLGLSDRFSLATSAIFQETGLLGSILGAVQC